MDPPHPPPPGESPHPARTFHWEQWRCRCSILRAVAASVILTICHLSVKNVASFRAARFSFWFSFCFCWSSLDLVFFSGYLIWQSWTDGAAFSILHSAFAFRFRAVFFLVFGRRHCVSWTFFGQNTFESWLKGVGQGGRQVGRHLCGLVKTLIGKFLASAVVCQMAI